jgi:hypothetical protein
MAAMERTGSETKKKSRIPPADPLEKRIAVAGSCADAFGEVILQTLAVALPTWAKWRKLSVAGDE